MTAAAVLVTAVWSYMLLDRTPDWLPWLRWVILIAGVLGAAAVLAGPWLARLMSFRRLVLLSTGLAMVAGLAGPAAYALDTVSTAHTGSLPTAGPATAGFGGGAPGGLGGARPGGTGGTGFAGTRPGGTSGHRVHPRAGAAGQPAAPAEPGRRRHRRIRKHAGRRYWHRGRNGWHGRNGRGRCNGTRGRNGWGGRRGRRGRPGREHAGQQRTGEAAGAGRGFLQVGGRN